MIKNGVFIYIRIRAAGSGFGIRNQIRIPPPTVPCRNQAESARVSAQIPTRVGTRDPKRPPDETGVHWHWQQQTVAEGLKKGKSSRTTSGPIRASAPGMQSSACPEVCNE